MIEVMKVMADNRLDAIVHKAVEHTPTLIKDGINPPYVNQKGAPHLNTFLIYAASMVVPGGLHGAGAAGGDHVLRPSLQRADDHQVRLRLRAGDQTSPSAEDHSAAASRRTTASQQVSEDPDEDDRRFDESAPARCGARHSRCAVALAPGMAAAQATFRIEEATIADVQTAIKSGQTTCRAVVQAYIERAKAYNGTCTALVTADGEPIPPAKGAVRAGAPITFPTQTVRGLDHLPELRRVHRAAVRARPDGADALGSRACSSSSACASASRTRGN